MDLHFFDRQSDYTVIERKLPHWVQPGVVCFITWRTDDSIPPTVLEEWRHERRMWLRPHQINPLASDWRRQLQGLDSPAQTEFYQHFSLRWHNELDKCHGACTLRDRSNAEIIANSLHHFDGDRYELTDFVVMPNHIHLLAAFPAEDSMLAQCESWKHDTAHQINHRLGTSGRFWQQDGFDHLVRSLEQFEHFRRYIARNGIKAKLSSSDYLRYSKPM